jgi:hypothetical protein
MTSKLSNSLKNAATVEDLVGQDLFGKGESDNSNRAAMIVRTEDADHLVVGHIIEQSGSRFLVKEIKNNGQGMTLLVLEKQ